MATGVPEWKKKAAAKREQQAASIPAEWRLPEPLPQPKSAYEYLKTSGVLTAQELEITETTDATILLRKMASGKLSAVAVTTAFSKRAAFAQQLIRCCTEMFFDEAIKAAQQLDDYLASNGKPVGPLHGLPVSLKDGFNVAGHDSTVGWVGEIGKAAKTDDTIAKLLRAQGAILYCKTNIPQSLMMSDSYNHIFKQSLNAFHNGLVSGGSSGGEGALVGARGSIVGIGTDIGGSIRIPANLQGLYGLQPSTRRVPQDKSGLREYIVPPVAGPLTTSLSTLEIFMDALLAAEPWRYDPISIPLPWRSELAVQSARPLRIGWYVDDGSVRVQPPHEAAVNKVITALAAAGHEVFRWDTGDHKYGIDLWHEAVLADGGKRCQLQCEKEGQPLIQGMLVGTAKDRLDGEQADALAAEIRQFQHRYLAQWLESKVDALIMPVQPWVGFRPKEWVISSQNVSYSAIWNLLDYGVLAMPVDTARPESLNLDEDPGDGRSSWNNHKPRNESDRYNWTQYDPALIAGMPVGVQVVGGKFGEEKAVSVAKAVEEAVKLASA